MIEEVLEKIKQAEVKGAEIIAGGENTARELSLHKESDIAALKRENEQNIIELKREIFAEATKNADKAYAEGITAAELEAKNITAAADKKVDGLAEVIFGRIVNGNR